VRNDCGSDSTRDTIEVLAPATAVGSAPIGVVDPNGGNPYQVCLQGDSVRITLQAEENPDVETVYFWEVITGDSYTWVLPPPQTVPDSSYQQVIFTAEGIYTVVLSANNLCNQPAYDTLTFVVEGGSFSLNPQPDGCVSLDYSPTPLLDHVNYTINGAPQITFPLTLTAGTYFVEAAGASNFCNNAVLRDTFLVLTQDVAAILTPDTTVCALDGPFAFAATPANGQWRINGDPFNGTLDPTAYPAGTYTISYGNEPCITTDQRLFTIVGAALNLPPATVLCIDDEPVTFAATPSGGTWSGVGVTPAGVFDPGIGAGEYTLRYAFENAAFPSCSNQDSFTVVVSTLDFDFIVDTCNGNTLCFALQDMADFDTVTWDFAGTGTSTATAPCHTFPAAGSYVVAATITLGNCSKTVSRTVAIDAVPVAGFELAYDPNRCTGLAVAITNTAMGNNLRYAWYRNGALLSQVANPPPLVLEAVDQSETYELRQVVTNDCATITDTVVVEPLPVSRLGIDQNQYCSGDTILLANVSRGNPDQYAWYLNDQLISTDSLEPVIAYTTEVADTLAICLVITNTCGSDTLCQPVVVVPTNVRAFFNTFPLVVCVGDSVNFVNFATSGVPVVYDFGDGNTTTESNPVYTYASPGVYTVTQQAFGCGTDRFSKPVTVVERPVAQWENPAFGCPGDALRFRNTSVGITQTSWDFGDGSPNSSETAPLHVFQEPGTYQVCLTVFSTAATTCSATLCQPVQIFAPPAAGFVFTDSLCLGAAITLTSTAVGDNLTCNYRLGDGNNSADCVTNHVYATPGAFAVTQIVQDDNFCTDTLTLPVYVRDLPLPAFRFATMNGCFPDSIHFTNESLRADSYRWDFGDGTTSTLTHPIHLYPAAGTYTVTLTAIAGGICQAELTQSITIDPTPTAILQTATATVCAGVPLAFASSSTGPVASLRWDFGDGLTSFADNLSHTFADAGVYTVELLVTGSSGCADTARQTITVFPPVAATASIQEVRCAGGNDGSIDLSTWSGTAPYSYNWSNGAATADIENLVAGTYTVNLIDVNNCRWDTTLLLAEPPALTATIETTNVSCFAGSDGRLVVGGIVGGTEPYQLSWNTGSAANAINNLLAGTYTLLLTDAQGCTQLTEVPLAQPDPLTFRDSVLHISCYGENDGAIVLTDVAGGTFPYLVLVNGNDYSAGGINVTRFDNLGPGSYDLQLLDSKGCPAFADYEVFEPDPTALNVVEDTVRIGLGETVTFTTDYTANVPTFSWFPADQVDCADCPEPTAQPFYDTFYELTMTNENGCTNRDTVLVLVDGSRDIFLPDAFTPNLDGRNDIFRVRSANPQAIVEIQSFQIFDRWGGLLFEARNFPPNDRAYGWDGKMGDADVAPGVYVYQVTVRYVDQVAPERFSGDVLLLR